MSEEEKVQEEAVETEAAETEEKKGIGEVKEDGSYEIKFEELGLSKDLEKMTAKELRDLCIEKLPMIQGVSSMSKEEIISTIKEMFGLETEPTAAEVNKGKILELKSTMRDLKAQRDQTEDPAQRDRLRKRISKLKKQTRRLAKSA